MKFQVNDTPLDGLKLLTRPQTIDVRGQFSRLFCTDQLSEFGWPNGVAQSNLSVSHDVGTVRGLHFQHKPHSEAKLVTCIGGGVFDVAVDLRAGSSNFGKWYGVELNADNLFSLLIPVGFAHGFQALQPNSTMIYFHSTAYNSAAESGVRWDDKDLAIDWPIPVKNISARDMSLPPLAALGAGIQL